MTKEVQKNSIKKQAQGFEIVHVNSKKIRCNGSGEGKIDSSTHPMVYLNMGDKDFVVCPYCSKYFTIKK